ncbi:MAG: GNAT family N-acetyltransferase, partial [Dehalococcoidia bacterium]|nr:GNAT family N-acetyltransferase [Dehalococcoidia bacterium]
MIQVAIKPFAELSEAERAARRRIDASVDWGSPNTPEPTWSPTDWSVMVWHDDVAVSKLGVLRRDALVGHAPVALGGVGGVATLPSQQGKGYASLALAET